ncbi:arsenate reductase (glutaredoxin) [Cytophaga aurantiaca]|uniref:arsenate reductase (glutaredoxin) n=1 Tax=Cytophaga aurantiaca TaxID=29530 RepID=UPI0003604D86|nr:arsenate reductase (glutaredoxin) [Cytophaga aurantiaca]
MITIYHNPRCQKSRTALQHIQTVDKDIKVVEYLKNPPSAKELKEVLELLQLKPLDIVRKKEQLFIDEYKDGSYTDTQWLKILVENPILIERPIIIKGDKAIIARDETSLKKIK